MSYFSVKIHHGGKFGFDGEPLHYVGGETSIVDYCDEDRWSRFEAMEIVLEQGYVVENIAAMWYKSLNDETDVGLRMLHTDKDAMDMARIGMRDNMVELFVVHKDAATTRKGCTIEEVEEIDGDEAAAPTANTIGPGPIVLHKAQSLAQAKVGKKPKMVRKAQNDVLEDGDEERSEESDFSGDKESEDDDYQPGIDDEGDSDEQWITTTKDPQRPKQSVPTEREQGEHSGSVNKGKEQVVAAGLRDEDDGYESEGLWDVPVSDDEGDPLFRRYPLYKGLKNMKEYKWEVGTMYVDRNAFKECVTSYAIHSGRGIWFSKCDGHRCKAVCKEEAREKPIVSMLEDIRVYLMNRWSDNRQSIVTYAGKILPKINKKIEREFDKGGEWLAIYAGRDKYEVSSSQGNRAKFVVDLNLHECSCRKFQLTGYPCEHAMSCIRKMCLDVKNYVNKCYRKETYVDCYQHNATAQAKKGAKKGAGTTRTLKSNKIPAKTTTQPATRLQPKRKSSTQVEGSQESQTSSKRARCSSSASQPQPSTATVTSPSRRTLRFMAKTPPRAWKALG
ncbi:hypothetical protein Ahy_A03g015110 [Arachis hypogaea]|uniref:SWIM-type domain-containing protein n=1 Tax=Arachis hypogaea TaxID=3818 RepID=A0A445DZW9_ARAHY|nr:hypothetical protein Ahy_A03g015110 [Arachis hypogaea]